MLTLNQFALVLGAALVVPSALALLLTRAGSLGPWRTYRGAWLLAWPVPTYLLLAFLAVNIHPTPWAPLLPYIEALAIALAFIWYEFGTKATDVFLFERRPADLSPNQGPDSATTNQSGPAAQNGVSNGTP